jgi:hypothetical protein
MDSRSGRRAAARLASRRGPAFAAAGVLGLTLATPGAAAARPEPTGPYARDDAYRVHRVVSVGAQRGVLGNDSGRPLTLVARSDPGARLAHPRPGRPFRYVPAAGFHGADTFTYTVSEAVRLHTSPVPGGRLTGRVLRPHRPMDQCGRSERDEGRAAADFHPQIGRFRFGGDGGAVLERAITLKLPDGTPYTGHVNSQASTGETITDRGGNPIPADPTGYDSAGPGRDAGRHVLGVRRVRAVDHPFRRTRPADRAALAVRRQPARRTRQRPCSNRT